MGKISFKNPPLNELVFGIQFTPNQLTQQVIFNYYNEFLKGEFPKIQENALLPPILDRAEKNNVFMAQPNLFQTRKLFLNSTNDIVIQLQADKFLLNWRKHLQNEYPHFDVVYRRFVQSFNDLLSLNSSLSKNINQYEITYVDHILVETLAQKKLYLSDIFSFFTSKQDMRNFSFNFNINQPSINGSLTVNARSAQRTVDRKQIIVIETTCRGFNQEVNMVDWFNEARRILIDYFDTSIASSLKSQWIPITQ